MQNRIIIYCDGACLGNPGPGGYAALLMRHKNDPNEKVICGRQETSTNNRMELKAAIEGLRALKRRCQVTIFSDSLYVVKGMTEWMPSWQESAFKKVNNVDLWQELVAVSSMHDVTWRWVKAHAGDLYNERVDEIAREQAGLALHESRGKK